MAAICFDVLTVSHFGDVLLITGNETLRASVGVF
jgi:hypothetical protein